MMANRVRMSHKCCTNIFTRIKTWTIQNKWKINDFEFANTEALSGIIVFWCFFVLTVRGAKLRYHQIEVLPKCLKRQKFLMVLD